MQQFRCKNGFRAQKVANYRYVYDRNQIAKIDRKIKGWMDYNNFQVARGTWTLPS